MSARMGALWGAFVNVAMTLVILALALLGIGLLVVSMFPLLNLSASPIGPDGKPLLPSDLASMVVGGATLMLAAFTAYLSLGTRNSIRETRKEAVLTQQLIRPRIELKDASAPSDTPNQPPRATVVYVGGDELAADVKGWFRIWDRRYAAPCDTPTVVNPTRELTYSLVTNQQMIEWTSPGSAHPHPTPPALPRRRQAADASTTAR